MSGGGHNYRSGSVIDIIDIDGSDRALRLEPIRPSGVGLGMGALPPVPHGYARSNSHDLSGGVMGGRTRRTSQDEIRALLQRTSMALDKIVKIRESMEPLVDFKQFEKGASRGAQGRTFSRASSGIEDAPIADQQLRMHSSGSYGSMLSEDQLGDRSTGSTESTSSSDEAGSSMGLDSSRGELDDHRSSRSHGLGATIEEDDSGLSDSDDDDDDTFKGPDLAPMKEARLERLKNITIAFHEGLPTEFFMALSRFLNSSVELKTRHSRFNFYKDTFVGSDAVRDMIVTGFAEDQSVALRYGNVLVKLGYIEHVSRTDDQLHNNKDNFYRFTRAIDHEAADFFPDPATRMSINANNYRESVLSRDSAASIEYDFSEASDEAHALVTDEALAILARVLHKVFERKNKLLFYKGFVGCFLGAEAVNVIRELRIASSLIDAVLIGQALLDEKIIEPIATNVTTFQDRYVFYRLTSVQG